MKKYLLNNRAFLLTLAIVLTSILVNAQRTASVSGNWNNIATWGGQPVPTSADDVIINTGITVTVNTNAQCNSVTFRSTSGTLTVSSGMTLDVSASVTLENTAGSNTAATLSGAGIINCASIVVGGNITAVTGNGLSNTLTSSVATLSVSGNISLNGEDNVNAETAATLSISSGTINVGGVIALDSDTDDNDGSATFTLNSGLLVLTAATPFTTNGLGNETIGFGSGTSTVDYAGSAQTVEPVPYRNLIYSGSGAKTSAGTVTVNVLLSMKGTATAGSAITYSSAILEYKGSAAQTTSTNEFPTNSTNLQELIIDNAAGVTINAAKTLNGGLTLTSGTLAAGNNLTLTTTGTPVITRSEGDITGTLQGAADYSVTYTGSSKTTGSELSGSALRSIIVNVTAGETLTLDQNRSLVAGDLTIATGTLDLSTFTLNRSAAGGTLAISDGATLKIGGTNAFPANYGTHTIGNTSATVEYAGAAQTVSTLAGIESYTNLTLSGSGLKTFTGETVNGLLSIKGTATTAGVAPGYGAAATLEYKGSAAQTTSVEFVGTGANPTNVKIDNSNGVTLNAAKTINGALTLTNGYLTTTNTELLTIGTGGSAPYSNGAFVNGPLAKMKNTTAMFTFPVGTLTGGLRTIGITPASTAATTFRATFFSANPKTSVVNGGSLGSIDQISGCEYWDLARTAGAANGKVTVSWPASANSCGVGGYVGNIATLIVAHHNGTNWTNEGQEPLTFTGTPSTGGTITSNNTLTSFSPFVLATTNGNENPLPVMFANVKAYQKNSGVQIEWSNLTERDLISYEVQRSGDGQNFATISSMAPRGNFNDKESYSAYDASPLPGVNYYRIRVSEITGKIIYSKLLKVDISSKKEGFSLYPNPVDNGQISVSLNAKQGQYSVRIVNMAGQQVYSQRLNHQGGSMTQTVEIPSSVKPGVYNMVISGDNYSEAKTFIIQ